MNKKKDGKITLGMLKGKSVTTSVPSISIKFHANVEQIEEVVTSEDETNKELLEKSTSSPLTVGEPENSPLKYFPKLGKRSTSIDVSQPQDSSPPSDPWRFFSDIKGKITKSVEEKITEIKARNQEDGSPHHKNKSDLKVIKDSKENSSISDSEDLSESSISKTCGIISTTEGVEMSSDEDTPSIEKDKKDEKLSLGAPNSNNLRQRFRFLRRKSQPEEGTVKISDLSKMCNINMEKNQQVLPEDFEVENAVDALEETEFKNDTVELKVKEEVILKTLVENYDNIEIDEENVVSIKEVSGKEIRDDFLKNNNKWKTVFAPIGFVDLRPIVTNNRPTLYYIHFIMLLISILLYVFIHRYSLFASGFAVGVVISFMMFLIYLKLQPMTIPTKEHKESTLDNKILEIQAVAEYQPILKYEGWVNEYPDTYNPETYHISKTQSVFLRLQGNLLRLNHSRHKVSKRAMWNEPEIKATFTHHRVYNLLGAKITLLPEGLAKKRHWSKKYPICISLTKNLDVDSSELFKLTGKTEENEKESNKSENVKSSSSSPLDKKNFKSKKNEFPYLAQRFSKLTEDEEFDLDSDSRASTPSADISDVADSPVPGDDDYVNTNENITADSTGMTEDWSLCFASQTNSPTDIKIYLFGRTDREKEDWFRRLSTATHKGIGIISTGSTSSNITDSMCTTLIEATLTDTEYLKYMSTFKSSKSSLKSDTEKPQVTFSVEDSKEDIHLWLNALIGRVLFDCVRNPIFIQRVQERIQRKLSTIKLPYFIEELLISELSLGKTSPFIQRTSKPVLDERGLWVDLDINYEGTVVLTLQTKLNLMRLKNPQAYEKSSKEMRSAIYHSDVDDSAESSSDEEGPQEIPNLFQDSSGGVPSVSGSGSSSHHSGKKFMKMVDRLAESKLFQAATENRYIKKAMEGVSNTDLRLTVEVKSIVGTLALNIPPPPSDRIWVGFRPLPEIVLSAKPVVGERNISYIMVTSWIEKKLIQEFQKILVIPNMEDFVIPVMNPKLPD